MSMGDGVGVLQHGARRHCRTLPERPGGSPGAGAPDARQCAGGEAAPASDVDPWGSRLPPRP
eukprot:7815011-Lingulodinium_polyedra.AAC.1